MEKKRAASAVRLKRYNESNDRKKQNHIINTNVKSFFGNLISKEASDVNETPSKQAVTHFWRKLWFDTIEQKDNTPSTREELVQQSNTGEQTDMLITHLN